MGADVPDFELGGGGLEVIGALLQVGSSGGVAVPGKDIGPDPQDGAGPE